MKKIIWLLFTSGTILFLLPTYTLSYTAPVETHKPTVSELITLYATKYHVSEKTMRRVIACESNFNTNAIGDHGKSFGLVQIHMPSHPTITKTQATTPEFAIEFLAKNLAKGNGRIWTCYRLINS